MSDDDHAKGNETDVEGHVHRHGVSDEPADAGDDEHRNRRETDDVEGHVHRHGVGDEPVEPAEDEIEAHVHKVFNVRMDSPSDD